MLVFVCKMECATKSCRPDKYPNKFPPDYMFVLDAEELSVLRSNFSSTKIFSKITKFEDGKEVL